MRLVLLALVAAVVLAGCTIRSGGATTGETTTTQLAHYRGQVLMHRPPGSVQVIRGGCRDIGGDEIITAQIATRHRRVFLASACLRGPGIAANERAFRAMARSAVATT